MVSAEERYEKIRQEWTDQYVEVVPGRPELSRFAGLVGRVITVNWGLKALVDFDDGGWYDITASEDYLKKVPAEEATKKYKGTANSAQKFPEKQG